jgi:hypothetical protein
MAHETAVDLPGRTRRRCLLEFQKFVNSSPDPLSLLLLKVGNRLMKAPKSEASENCSLTAGKIHHGHPPVQR